MWKSNAIVVSGKKRKNIRCSSLVKIFFIAFIVNEWMPLITKTKDGQREWKGENEACFKEEGQDQPPSLPSVPTLHPSSWTESSSCSSSSSSSSLPCAQGCSLGKGKPYLPLTQPPRINAGHRCCTAQTHTLIAAMASKLLLSPVSIHVFLFAYIYICPSL